MKFSRKSFISTHASCRDPFLLHARGLALVLLLFLCSVRTRAYSVLTHEEIVDLLWTSNILPLIEQRFPGLTDDQIKEAHAYAYGGSVIQDLGYYPFGSKEFSDLVHYVRSGDFVAEMIRQSQDAKEYAFALGALAHYISDVDGHPVVNQAVAMRYPKLREKYGSSVKYAQDKTAHLKTEFGFDTLQVAKNRYAPQQYHDFIGFEVSEPLLERVFPLIYGMDLKDALPHEELAIGSYRWAISQLIPHMTTVALQLHQKELASESPNFEKKKFIYRLSRADYEKSWGTTYQRPGFGTRFLATILRIMPKVGPFKGLGFIEPTKTTEDLYIKSINKTFDDYRRFLRTATTRIPDLPNRDLDTGAMTRPAEYTLTDDTYEKLLTKLAEKKFAQASPDLRDDILRFYSDQSAPVNTKRDEAKWQHVLSALDQLKAAPPAVASASSPTE
jgi:Zinc dependent phospholipase C